MQNVLYKAKISQNGSVYTILLPERGIYYGPMLLCNNFLQVTRKNFKFELERIGN